VRESPRASAGEYPASALLIWRRRDAAGKGGSNEHMIRYGCHMVTALPSAAPARWRQQQPNARRLDRRSMREATASRRHRRLHRTPLDTAAHGMIHVGEKLMFHSSTWHYLPRRPAPRGKYCVVLAQARVLATRRRQKKEASRTFFPGATHVYSTRRAKSVVRSAAER